MLIRRGAWALFDFPLKACIVTGLQQQDQLLLWQVGGKCTVVIDTLQHIPAGCLLQDHHACCQCTTLQQQLGDMAGLLTRCALQSM